MKSHIHTFQPAQPMSIIFLCYYSNIYEMERLIYPVIGITCWLEHRYDSGYENVESRKLPTHAAYAKVKHQYSGAHLEYRPLYKDPAEGRILQFDSGRNLGNNCMVDCVITAEITEDTWKDLETRLRLKMAADTKQFEYTFKLDTNVSI